jgi:cytidine deaminase
MSDLIKTLITSAKQALNHAYAPYSLYQVACCLSTEDGSLYTGVNVENACYGLTLCAEASAICQMVSAGKQKITAMVILNGTGTLCSPCGACRQRILEFADEKTVIHLCNHQSVLETFSIDTLLPHAFRFKPGISL